MSDPRQDYIDPAPTWAEAQIPDPTGLRPCDRAHLAGWFGLFIALMVTGIGIGYGAINGGSTVRHLAVLMLMGSIVAAFGFAGISLIVKTLSDRSPAGPLLLLCNAMIVGPILIPGVLAVVGVVPASLIVVLGTYQFSTPFEFWISLAVVGVFAVFEVVILCRSGRQLLQMICAWLDPTNGQWW